MERSQSPTVRGLARAHGEKAIHVITAPYREEREGWRHMWLGDSGTGKSTANRALLEAVPTIVVAHDDTKLAAQYAGTVIAHTDDLEGKQFAEGEDSNALVFRGDVYAGRVVEVEDVAALALRFARARVPVTLAVDELDRAVTPGGQQLQAPSLRVCLTQGRALGLSVSSTTQSPARAPKEVIDQATTAGLFRLGPRSISYLDERLQFEAEMLDVLPTLQRGEFVLYRAGYPWDRTIYRFPPPAAL